MTQRLYFLDSHLFENECTVLSCRKAAEGYDVVVDKTVFFPNKGGQPCDTGFLGEAKVSDCREEGDELILRTDRPLAPGTQLIGRIDRDRRLDIMAQHTGEHLLSWCAYTLFSAGNVGFHCALSYATLDLDRPLSGEELRRMEAMANELVRADLAVTARFYDREEDLSGVPLRKHSEGLTAPIRVVFIENADSCTCCAPHVRRTGEIGSLLITAAAAYKGGMRLTFLCGNRAVAWCRGLQGMAEALGRRFSVGQEQILDAVEKQERELREVKKEKAALTARLETYLTRDLMAEATDVRGRKLLVKLTETDPKRLRPLALSTLPEQGLTLLLCRQNEQLYYVLCAQGVKLDMGELIIAVNLALGGRGGGRGALAQGSAPMPGGLSETIDQLHAYLRNRLQSL